MYSSRLNFAFQLNRLGLPGVAATPRIARRGCLKHVDAAMLIAWMEKIEKTQTKYPFRGPRTTKSRHGESQPNEPCAFESMRDHRAGKRRVGQPQHNDNTVPGSHGMGSILD